MMQSISKQLSLLCSAILLLILAAMPGVTGAMPNAEPFQPVISAVGVLSPGVLGLPGEPITWIVTVTNQGTARGVDLVVSHVLHNELRIESVEVERGWQTVEGQVVKFSIPSLEPGETVGMQIVTTVAHGPADGTLTNRVTLRAKGQDGVVVKETSAEIYVPTGLPATGYPPEEDLPGHDEPPLAWIALLAAGMVIVTAFIIYQRGKPQT